MLKINNSFDTIIIGAGFAGIGMAIRLKQNGYNLAWNYYIVSF